MKKNIAISSYWTNQKKAESLLSWKKRTSLIKDSKGEVFFEMKTVEAPESWSQLAVDIAASRYFRKKGVPGRGFESSIKQLVNRVVQALVSSAKQQKYFSDPEQLKNFSEELKYILYTQKAAFNSPVWFNVGLSQSYKLKSPSHHWAYDFKTKKITPISDAYLRPQASACFIQSIEDSLEGIFELAKTEAKLFKYGSGSGTNFSNLRSKYEAIESGGKSSGLISFLEVLDRGAGAIKSGGTTRRAAKMVIVNVDHPEIIDFIRWKKTEEEKAKALIAAGYSSEYEGVAYKTVSGQNANNSVRISNAFMKAIEKNRVWKLKAKSGQVLQELPAQKIWDEIIESAWSCADPGLQFHDTINQWHTCIETGEIKASNPCSEFMFLDDTACNLASINLTEFQNAQGDFDLEGFRHTVHVLLIAQDILVDFASYPTEKIAQNSHDFRPLGLGFANLGAFLMRQGLAYDSDEARLWASAITSFMTAQAYCTSHDIANRLGSFKGFKKNKSSFQKVMKKHFAALKKIKADSKINSNLKKIFSESEILWKKVVDSKSKFRNSQVSVIAPTGTIALLMDCDTTGIEPDFSLLKFKKLAGGGEIQIVNQSVGPALVKLGYTESEITHITDYILKHGHAVGCSQLSEKHLKVFECASGEHSLRPESHLLMMAAVQPFISGAISKTVNLPQTATRQQLAEVYWKAWKLGLKSVALYRDGSKGSQPLMVQNKVQNHNGEITMKCPECGTATELHSGCYRCPSCGFTAGCA